MFKKLCIFLLLTLNLMALTKPPYAPENVREISTFDTVVKFQWDTSLGADSYKVYYETSGGLMVYVGTTTFPDWREEGLTPNQTYNYKVKASNNGGDSPYSELYTIKTTHTWSGALQECVNMELQKDVDYIPSREELANLIDFTCTDKGLINISPLADLTALQNLTLDFNWGISDISPISLLADMRTLSLYMTNVNDLSALSGMTQLTSFKHKGKQIADISPLSHMPHMEVLTLWLSDTVTDLSPLSAMQNMKSLYIGTARGISDISALLHMFQLDGLTIRIADISDISLFAQLNTLTKLNLQFNRISDISALAALNNLASLTIEYNHVHDISVLESLHALTYVSLGKNCIKDFSPVALVANVVGANDQRVPNECMPFNPALILYLLD